MVIKTDFFWTDTRQASERLEGCIILYDDYPVYIRGVTSHDDGHTRAMVEYLDGTQKTSRKKLNSPLFERFRRLPNIGWINNPKYGAMFVSRIPSRIRQHGLISSNVSVRSFDSNILTGAPLGLFDLAKTSFFADMHKGKYPSLEDVLKNINNNTAFAVSRKYCVRQDTDGLTWLYREDTRVGIISGEELLLIKGKAFLVEEIMESPELTFDIIKEF